jgi:hypothetical protein
MYSFKVFNQIKEELNLELLEVYDETKKYISTTKFCMKCNFIGCDTPISIQFVALLRSKKPYCKTHRYSLVGEKISKSKSDKNKPIYDENRKKLYNLINPYSVLTPPGGVLEFIKIIQFYKYFLIFSLLK